MRIAMMLLALALATTGCKKKENKPAETTGSGSEMVGSDMAGSDMAGSGSDMAGSGSDMAGSDMAGSGSDMAGSGETQMSKRAGNCPSTVLGATTKAEVKGKGLVVTITTKDKNAVAAIQKRTEELLADKKGGAGSPASGHDQKGTHGGSVGLCPVHVPAGASTSMKKMKDGVAVTITPKDKVDELKTEVDARITKADEWVKANIKDADKGNQGGVGGGKGDHGANHSGEGDAKGVERKAAGSGDGKGGGKGTGGGGGKGTGGGEDSGSAEK